MALISVPFSTLRRRSWPSLQAKSRLRGSATKDLGLEQMRVHSPAAFSREGRASYDLSQRKVKGLIRWIFPAPGPVGVSLRC